MMEINGTFRLRFGAYEVDLHTHELWKHGIKVKLVGQPFEILGVLVRRPGELVTREELRAQLWPGDTFVDFDHGLNAAVNKLRDALCDSAEDPKYIETLPRRGYRFVATVEKVGTAKSAESESGHADVPSPAQQSVAPDVDSSPVGPSASPSITETPIKKSHRLRWIVAAVAVAAGIAVLWFALDDDILDMIRGLHDSAVKKEAEGRGPRSALALTSLSDPTSEPAFSTDGSHIVFRRESFLPGVAGLYVKQVGGEDLIQLTADKNDHCPTWSADGKWIAFDREQGRGRRPIYKVPAKGGDVEPMHSIFPSGHCEMDWSPDGKSIAYVDRSAAGQTAIFLMTPDGEAARAVTMPPAGEGDWGPAFSPDGERMAFVRAGGDGLGKILVMPAEGGEARVVVQASKFTGPPAWTSDGESLVFSAVREAGAGLYRVSAAGGVPTAIQEASGLAWRPTIARRGFRLAFQQVMEGRSIAQLDLYPPGQKPRSLVMTASGENGGGQFSPDGTRLVFFSDRLGSLDLWVSDRNGQNPVQLTSIGTTGTPRWSPDGKTIAFDVGLGRDWQRPRALFAVKADGGSPHALVQDSYNNPAPSWSRDGKWIYFPSDRSGEWQVWKIPAEGGTPTRLTKQGGFAAWEGADGNLYYAKSRYDNPELWRVPLAGGAEAPVYPPVRPLTWASWTVTEKGILFVGSGTNNSPTLRFFNFSTLRLSDLAVLDRSPFWLGVSPDGKTVVFDEPGNSESHIMMLENFR